MTNSDDLRDVRRRLDQSDGLDEAAARELLVPICGALRDLGVTGLEARYGGSGDNGAVEEMTVEPADFDLPEDLRELIDDWICAALPSTVLPGTGSNPCSRQLPANIARSTRPDPGNYSGPATFEMARRRLEEPQEDGE